MKRQKRRIAIFDIDGTIFRSSLLIELIDRLIDEGMFPQKVHKELETDYIAWSNRKGSYTTYVDKVSKLHIKHIRGCNEVAVKRVAKMTIKQEKDKVYTFTRDLIKKLKKQNYYLIAISGSPDYIVSMFSKYMGFDASFGRKYEVTDGAFTGNAIHRNLWSDKAAIMEKVINETPIEFDLARSLAIGDTETDIPLLELVGKPIAFNPNSELAHYAQKMGWEIVVERKDVVYTDKKLSVKSH
jgi:HAD superfamily hydrolase (TIGR01490 family)